MSSPANASLAIHHPLSPITPWIETPQDLCLDTDYSGHLLLESMDARIAVHTAENGATPTPRQEITETPSKPLLFDDTTVCNVRSWWTHLLPDVSTQQPTPSGEPGLPTTAEEMFRAYVDPYAQFRRRVTNPVVESLRKDEQLSASNLVSAAASLITPPGQLYQRFDYEDGLLAMPPASQTVLPSIRNMVPELDMSFLASGKQAPKEGDDQEETPKELIEAAVAALVSIPGTTADDVNASASLIGVDWTTPASADFSSDPAFTAAASGVVRSRASFSMIDTTTAAWYGGHDMSMFSPDSYQLDFQVPITAAVAGNGEHRCLWLGCQQVLPSPAALTLHVNRCHIARRQPAHRCLWQGCAKAEHVFRHRDKILIHMRLHTKDRPFVCDTHGCDRHFSRADSLESHKKVHAAEGKVFECRAPECTRTYFHAKSLKKHERTAHDLDLDL